MIDAYDYHFLILAPDLSGAWFLQAARQYWLQFKPIVTDDWQLITAAPADKSVAVTLLARPQKALSLRQTLAAAREGLYIDLIEAHDLPSVEVLLNQRAVSGSRFGDSEGSHETPGL